MRIGALIKARRKVLELSQKSLASMLGISRGSLANIETGRQRLLVHQLYSLAVNLGLRPSDLLPAPLSDDETPDTTDLPMPANLKAQQRKQIARLFSQVGSAQEPSSV
jgi:transcriptional regulator with XRE-family HTH domain